MNEDTGVRSYNISGSWTDGTEQPTDYTSLGSSKYHKFLGDPTGYIHEKLSDGWTRTQFNLTIPQERLTIVGSGIEEIFDWDTWITISGETANDLTKFVLISGGFNYDAPETEISGLHHFQDFLIGLCFYHNLPYS